MKKTTYQTPQTVVVSVRTLSMLAASTLQSNGLDGFGGNGGEGSNGDQADSRRGGSFWDDED